MTKPLCLYRADDPDALLAAWAARRALGDDVEFVAVREGDLSPYCVWQDRVPGTDWKTAGGLNCAGISGRDVLILGVSYPLPTLHVMAAEARSVLVFSHLSRELMELPIPPSRNYKRWQQIFEDKDPIFPNLAAIFDPSRSTAAIAWDYLHAGAPCPRIVELTADYALDRFKYGDEARAFHAVLASYDWADLQAIFWRLDNWDRLLRAQRQALARNTHLFRDGSFTAHSGAVLPYKIDCDALTDADLSTIAAEAARQLQPFARVTGVPRGGLRLAAVLEKHCQNGGGLLIAEDVLTTGASMEEVRKGEPAQGIVIFARGPWASWITPIFCTPQALVARDLPKLRRTMRIAGHVVPVANVMPSMADEAGRLMCQETNDRDGAVFWRRRNEGPFPHKNGCYPLFAATYHDGPDKRHFTLHSPAGGADCGEVARQLVNAFAERTDFIGSSQVWTASGNARRAEFDAPLGWEREQ